MSELENNPKLNVKFKGEIEAWKKRLLKLEKYLKDFYEHNDKVPLEDKTEYSLSRFRYDNNPKRQGNYSRRLDNYRSLNEHCKNKVIDQIYCTEYSNFLKEFSEANTIFQSIDISSNKNTRNWSTYKEKIIPLMNVFKKYKDLIAYLSFALIEFELPMPILLPQVYSQLKTTFCDKDVLIGNSCETSTKLIDNFNNKIEEQYKACNIQTEACAKTRKAVTLYNDPTKDIEEIEKNKKLINDIVSSVKTESLPTKYSKPPPNSLSFLEFD
jgi:hypothetical protein